MMKRHLATILALLMAAAPFAALAAQGDAEAAFHDEMKIPYHCNLDPEDGADSKERAADNADSPYYKFPDFYHMESTESLTILSNFQTYQQTSEWSCGVASALMVLNWYDRLGEHNEESLARLRSNGLTPEATSVSQLAQIFEGVGGFDVYSVLDCPDDVHDVFTLAFIQDTLKAGNPIIIGWNDWGGHWQVIIGYDTMGTQTEQDDVIIIAEPYDTTDHNQDGYATHSALRFLYNFSFYNYFSEESGEPNEMCFLIATPK